MTTVAHLTASSFYGGPQRQMLGFAQNLLPQVKTILLRFSGGGTAWGFIARARRQGLDALVLANDTPHFRSAMVELAAVLRRLAVDVLFCHGYKAGLLGRVVARRLCIPVVAVSRGWTRE